MIRSLTKTWGDFGKVACSKEQFVLTYRLFFRKLEDKYNKEPPLYLTVNSLSGAVDIFDSSEGECLEAFIRDKDPSVISDKLFSFLRKRGYIFPSKNLENLAFDTVIKHHKYKKYFKDKILGYFSIDMSCPMGCKYCFEKKYSKDDGIFENALMDKTSIDAAFNFLNFIKDLQEKEIDFVAGWGGEPLQEKNSDINEYFIKKAVQNGYKVAYFSNLAFVGAKLTKILSEHAENFKFIQTTLDDIPTKHDHYRNLNNAFERTVNAIDGLLKSDLPVIVRTNVGEHNIDALPYLAEFYEEKGWFNYPKFKGFITHVYDRHHEFTQKFTGYESKMLSRFLELRDNYRCVRKIQGIKFAPSVSNIIKAFKLREVTDITEENFEVEIKPIISYCVASSRAEYVFTGAPNYSIYNCAECTGLSKFKIGHYYPEVNIDDNAAKMWGINNSIHDVRSIDSLDKCKNCKAATFCGGYCALEAICDNGNVNDVFCKQADVIINDFLEQESDRLYRRAKILLEKTENISI